MNDRIAQLLAQMTTLEDDLRAAVQDQESKLFFNIRCKRM